MRLFIAIPIPEDVSEQLVNLQQPVEGVRWVPVDQRHLTLKFVGQLDDQQRKLLIKNLKGVRFDPFDICIKGLGFFPEKGTPRVFWAGVSQDDSLIELQKRVEKVAIEAGAEKDRFSYKPHVTLARIKNKSVGKDDLRPPGTDFVSRIFTVDRFNLFKSLLRPDGAVHEVVKRYKC